MPIIKAAIKHLRKSEKQRAVNRMRKNRLKDTMKEMIKLAAAKKRDEFAKKLPEAMSLIDKSTKGHIIHRNNAARKKSRLAHLLASLK
jgi:small subunit ribosomal protein S20